MITVQFLIIYFLMLFKIRREEKHRPLPLRQFDGLPHAIPPVLLGLLHHALLALADETGHGDDLLALFQAFRPHSHGHPA